MLKNYIVPLQHYNPDMHNTHWPMPTIVYWDKPKFDAIDEAIDPRPIYGELKLK